MLYIIHMGNYPELSYSGGQGPIVHLVADLHDVVVWAESVNKKWAFTDCNAGAYYAEFLNDLDKLHELNWESINATDFRDPRIKDGKQAKFLMHEWFPWHLIEKVGVLNQKVADDIQEMVAASSHQPAVNVEPQWYY